MFQSINENFLEKILISLYFITASYFCYEVSSSSFNLMNIDYKFITNTSSLLSSLLPLTIFIFYLFTSKYMILVYDINFNAFSIIKIISISYLPVFFTHFISLLIIISLTHNQYDSEYTYLDDSFGGYKIKTLFNIFEYCWILFYMIFIYSIKRKYKLGF